MMALVCSSIEDKTTAADDLPGVVQLDPWLSPFKDALRKRYSRAQQWIKTIDETEGGLEKFSRVGATRKPCWWSQPLTGMQGFEKFGFNVLDNNDIIYREWAPNALRAYLIGDFSEPYRYDLVYTFADGGVNQTTGIARLRR